MKSIKGILLTLLILTLMLSFSNIKKADDFINILFKNGESSSSNESNIEKGILLEVIDGDTIKVEFSNKRIETVRMLLIDTPESVKPNTPVQPFGKEAANFLRTLLIKGNVVEIEKGNPDRDNYNRLLAYVWLDGVNINKLLLEKGYARIAYVYPPNIKYLDDFRVAEKKAKGQRIGIWSIENYVHQDGFYIK